MSNDPNYFPDDETGIFNDLDSETVPSSSGVAPASNRRFVILAVLLVFIILIGVGVIIFFAIRQGEEARNLAGTRAAIVASNEAVNAALTRTTIALTFTKTPTPTATPTFTFTPTNTPSITPTNTASPTATLDLSATSAALTAIFVAQQTQTLAPEALTSTANARNTQFAILTGTANARRLTEQAGTPGTPTPTGGAPGVSPSPQVIVVTPTLEVIPNTPTPTFGLSVFGTPATPVAMVTVGGVGGQGGRGGMPETGFFDDLGLSSPSGLPIVALIALGLVAIIVVARRLRVKA